MSNKLFVTIDIFFDMRCHIRRGEPPGNTAQTVLESALLFARSSALQALADEEKTYTVKNDVLNWHIKVC